MGEATLQNGAKLFLGGYYRTPSGHAVTQQAEFDESLQNLKKYSNNSNDTIIIGGDFNFRDINWDTDSVPPCGYERTASYMLINTLNEHFLSQLQRLPTREENVLDLYITNKPSQVKSIYNVPNISDHEGAIVVDSNIRPVINKKKPHTYHLFSKADWPAIREDLKAFSVTFLQTHSTRTVDENWEVSKTAIKTAIDKHVPIRTSKAKSQQTWISSSIRRKARKKHRLYRKAIKKKDPASKAEFKTFKKQLRERSDRLAQTI